MRAFSSSRALLAPEAVKMWIDGKLVESQPKFWIDLTNPVAMCFYLSIDTTDHSVMMALHKFP